MLISARIQPTHQHASKGVVLIITLFMMALVTLTTLTSIRGSLIEEKMAGHSRDRNKAQQAAEAALRHCLRLVIDNDPTLIGRATTPTAPPNQPVWESGSTWNDSSLYYEPVLLNVEAQLTEKPRCVLENMTTGGTSYRITSRGRGGSDFSVVMLQATYTNE